MEIIEIPHPSLRKTSKEVLSADTKLANFVRELSETLENKRNPKGVGLAAPQVNKLWRVFAAQVEGLEIFINPVITNHSSGYTLGPDEEDPILEGCLSMPKIYGAVPRWEWVLVEYDALVNGELEKREERFDDFYARVIQHEIDHLDGILFTDHSLKYDLPVYQEYEKEKYREVNKEFLEII